MAVTKSTSTPQKEATDITRFINLYPKAVLFFLMALISFVVFKDFIFFKKIYLFKDIGSDSINMYVPWFDYYADYVKKEGTPGWSFAQGMGQNIFPLWLGDFFSNIMMYFDKSNIVYALAYMEIAKILLAGIVFYSFLKELKLSNYVSVLFALLYAFSGFMVMGGSWVIYSIEALYVAIILYGFERWLNHNKFFWFVTGITLLTFLQPFLLYPYTIFLACYITARYFDVKAAWGKPFFTFVAKTIGLAALAVLISSYQLFADLLQIIESPRVGGDSSLFDKLKEQPLFGLSDEWLRFTTVFRSFGTDMIGNGSDFKGWQYNYLEAPLFYCGLLCLVMFPHFFSSLSKTQKRVYGVVTAIFCLPILFPYFRYIFWAFSGDYYRTLSLVIVLFLLIFSARALNYIEEQKKLNKIVLGVTLLVLLILLFTPASKHKANVNDTLQALTAILLLVYGFFAFRISDAKVASGNLKLIVLLVCVVELMVNSYSTVNKRRVMSASEVTAKVGYNDYTVESVNYLKQIDKGFYRLNKDYFSGLAMHGSVNDAKVQGFYGTSSYHSFNQKNYIKFLGDFGVINTANEFETRWAAGLGQRPILFSLAAGKYWLSKRADNAVASMGFDSIAKFGDVKVYKSRYFVPFGVTYNQTIGESDFKKLSSIQKDFCALRACVVSNDDATAFAGFKKFNLADTNLAPSFDNLAALTSQLKKDSLTMTKFSENNFAGTINVNEPRILFLSFPMDDGWKAKINNTEAPLYKINAGLTGLILNKGANTVELSFEPRLKNKGLMVSIISLLVFAGLLGFTRYKKSNQAAT